MKKIKLTRIVIHTETEMTRKELEKLREKLIQEVKSEEVNFQYSEL